MRTEAQRATRRRYDASDIGKAAKKRDEANYKASGKRALAEKRRVVRPISEARKRARKAWAKRNTWYSAADRAHRRMLMRYPMSAADRIEVQGMYLFCSIFAGFEVDHIVPIKNNMVCGLHVLSNLQVISRTENRQKSNKFCLEELHEHDY